MAEFRISRLRYTWKGNWSTAINFNKDDVVKYGGSVWVCIRQHTSSTFLSDQQFYANPSDTEYSPAWTKMGDGYGWRGAWQSSTLYSVGDVIKYGGNLYLAVTEHTSQSNFEDNIGDWTTYAVSINFREDWTPSTRYGVGDVVNYGGKVYKCINGHTSDNSTNGLSANLSDWTDYYTGVDYVGEYSPSSVRYKLNELVQYNGSILKCISGYTSGPTFDETKWEVELPGYELTGEWNNSVYYGKGAVVRYGGFLYVCIDPNLNSAPFDAVYQPSGVVNWAKLSGGVNFRGGWSSATSYRTGDVVRRGGNLYKALLDTSVNDGSSLDYLDDSNWELITTAQEFRNFWQEGELYSINDIVTYLGNLYKCNTEHIATDENFPGDNGSGFVYWDLVLEAASPAGLKQRGELLTFDFSRTLAGDDSTQGITGTGTGVEGELFTVNTEGSIVFRNFGQVQRTFFVGPDGSDNRDDALQGTSPFKPWATVRYACEQADDGFAGHTTIFVYAGVYEEVLPIIVPKKTVVLGSELRSTTITAKTANALLATDSQYTIAVLNRIRALLSDILTNTEVTPTPGNSVAQVTNLPTSDVLTANQAELLVDDIVDYIDFYINSAGTEPNLVGTNTANTDPLKDYAADILEANKEFLAQEAVAYQQANNPSYVFEVEGCKRDVRRYIDAIKYDIVYTGNYKSVLAARYYKNAVLGSQGEDMFYLRDASGLRNCTLKGLAGALNPPNVFDLYRRPTGGSFCSLDPGWGTGDDRCWITTRSPYIQNVTTFGTGCVGQKVDGALHDGGNRSFVSNDFTQVLSDGIGAWITNNGRAELVSVFTYYNQVGYLAENGGRIRAANGNCSYGDFGAVADDIDSTEVPRTGLVNNRTTQATVSSVVSGRGPIVEDEIKTVEFSNAGQFYTNASGTITGSGSDANIVFDDFRDQAIHEIDILDANAGDPDAISEDVGGGGYAETGGNAQTGTDTTITLASNDAGEPAQYAGKRIIIVAGPGTGQYGYINSYSELTKIANVYRESDDQAGWDNVVAGWPNTQLTAESVYRIEPRVTIAPPRYDAQESIVPFNTPWGGLVYGETTETFTGVVGEIGTGEVVEDDGLAVTAATFNVQKVGRVYNVTINNPGAGYVVGDTMTLLGENLGGLTPYNNLNITVTETTDDSTDSITSFTFTGIGASGKYVAVTEGGTAGMYSRDGSNWSGFNLPTSGSWSSLAAGNNKFVAVRKSSNRAATSNDGINWSNRVMPTGSAWSGLIYGDGVWVAVSETGNDAAFSTTDGATWTSSTLPDADDSTLIEYVDVAYGKNKFVAVSKTQNLVAVGTYDSDTDDITWVKHVMDVIDDSSQKDWSSITYGNNRFVAVSTQGDVAYSFDGADWFPATMPKQDGSTAHYWNKIRYGQGVFFAVGETGNRVVGADATTGESTFAATSPDGIVWTSRTLASEKIWRHIASGNPYTDLEDSTVGRNTPIWVALDNAETSNVIRTGKTAQARVDLAAGIITEMKIWDPGSGYDDHPTITITDPVNTSDALFEGRIADGVLSQPSFINRGFGYRAGSTSIEITGDGFADNIPTGKFVNVDGLTEYPGPGTQLLFAGNAETYTVVAVTPEDPYTNTGLSAILRLTPELKIRDLLEHDTGVTLRENYSQVRLTGHDFLDVGTGNLEETNYPTLYSTGNYVGAPENEVVEEEGGRVFYTSTDQSGNFRTGELFAVEQATGIVTISADFFDLSGLSELNLGGIRVGGTGAVIREFSTDATFTEDSNNIVPTQRSIAAYLANRLSLGGSEISTSSFIAGTVQVGPAVISNTGGLRVLLPRRMEFDGATSGISGGIMAQTMFFRSFDIDED